MTFEAAVAAIDAGDIAALRDLPPHLLHTRFDNGRDDYFARPYRTTAEERQVAFSGAALHGRVDALRDLLTAGVRINAFNPPGWHAHSTALHSAVASGNVEAMRLLAEAGADLTIEDTLFHSTPRGWALYLKGSDPFI